MFKSKAYFQHKPVNTDIYTYFCNDPLKMSLITRSDCDYIENEPSSKSIQS